MGIQSLRNKGVEVVDRRKIALGGQANNRKLSDIDTIAIHYTATLNGTIQGHENFWKNNRGWTRGGYLVWIDRNGVAHWNYDYERTTWGAGANWNKRTAHLSMESNSKHNYTDKQIETMYKLIDVFLEDLPNTKPERVFGHHELTNNTACPGWNSVELGEIRRNIKNRQHKIVDISPIPVKNIQLVAQEVINGLWGNGKLRFENLKEAGYVPQDVQNEVNNILNMGTKKELKANDVIAQEVIDGKWGNGADRKTRLNAAGYNYDTIQTIINERLKPKPKKKTKSLSAIVMEVVDGSWGNGQDRFKRLTAAGYNAREVQNEVNRRYTDKKSTNQLAHEVINGIWGNNPERKNRLLKAGYNPDVIQKEVNRLL